MLDIKGVATRAKTNRDLLNEATDAKLAEFLASVSKEGELNAQVVLEWLQTEAKND